MLNVVCVFLVRYPRNLTCVWNITAKEGHFVILDFDDFELESPQQSGACPFDYIVFDGGECFFASFFVRELFRK